MALDEIRDSLNDIEAQKRLELATEAAGIGIWEWDLLTNRMRYSPRARTIYGFAEQEEITLDRVRAGTHPEDLPRTSEIAKRARDPALKERIPYEYRVVWPDGRIRWVLAFGHVIFEQNGQTERATKYVGTIQDITARKETESALEESSARLQLAIDAGQMAVWEFDAASETIASSPQLNRILGFADDATPTIQQIRAGYLPGEQQRLRMAAADAVQGPSHLFQTEFGYQRPDGDKRWLLLRATFRMAPEGTPKSVLGIVADITDRKAHEEHIQFIMRELSHRSKNLLAVVQSMVRFTARQSRTLEEFEHELRGRLNALSTAHDILLKENWRGAPVREIVEAELRLFPAGEAQLSIEGPFVRLRAETAQNLAIAIHELATNAAKYGAWSVPDGRVEISWRYEGDGEKLVRLSWIERGVPDFKPPDRKGFGTMILSSVAQSSPKAEAGLQFGADGISWTTFWSEENFLEDGSTGRI